MVFVYLYMQNDAAYIGLMGGPGDHEIPIVLFSIQSVRDNWIAKTVCSQLLSSMNPYTVIPALLCSKYVTAQRIQIKFGKHQFYHQISCVVIVFLRLTKCLSFLVRYSLGINSHHVGVIQFIIFISFLVITVPVHETRLKYHLRSFCPRHGSLSVILKWTKSCTGVPFGRQGTDSMGPVCDLCCTPQAYEQPSNQSNRT